MTSPPPPSASSPTVATTGSTCRLLWDPATDRVTVALHDAQDRRGLRGRGRARASAPWTSSITRSPTPRSATQRSARRECAGAACTSRTAPSGPAATRRAGHPAARRRRAGAQPGLDDRRVRHRARLRRPVGARPRLAAHGALRAPLRPHLLTARGMMRSAMPTDLTVVLARRARRAGAARRGDRRRGRAPARARRVHRRRARVRARARRRR